MSTRLPTRAAHLGALFAVGHLPAHTELAAARARVRKQGSLGLVLDTPVPRLAAQRELLLTDADWSPRALALSCLGLEHSMMCLRKELN